ncbi:MAG: hypothetical protein LQ343_000707 [Gyalolechia ehrenbergii]|nr:MAG: hypothetical protein LQ343_000707 [Gyalolechia ehrenbergii]
MSSTNQVRLEDLIFEAFRFIRGISSVGETEQISTANPKVTGTLMLTNPDAPSKSLFDRATSERGEGIGQQPPRRYAEDISADQTPSSEDVKTTSAESQCPLSANNKKELVAIIKEWIEKHPNQRFPAVVNHDHFSFAEDFAREVTLVGSEERCWILRLGIIERYQGWVLERPDGSHVLVRAHYYRKDGHVYFPWLGDDRGFSDEVIAHHRQIAKKKYSIRVYARLRGLDPEDVLNEYDISKQDLEPSTSREAVKTETKRTKADAHDSDSSLTSLSSLIPLMNHWRGKKAKGLTSKRSAKKRGRTGKLPKATKAIRIEPKEDLNELTAPKEGFPPSPSSITPRRSTRTITNPHIPHAPRSPYEFPFSVPTTLGPPALQPDGDGILYTPPSSIAPIPSLGTPFTPSQNTVPTGNAIFHLYVSDPTFGAIPHSFSLSSLPTHKRFFTLASAAHHTIPIPNNHVVAASVRVSGAERPIVVKDDASGKAAWEETKRVVCEKGKEGGRVEAEVRCIAACRK